MSRIHALLLVAFLALPAVADDALDRGGAILRGERALRDELLGESVYRVLVGGEPVGFFRTVTSADEHQGRPVYRIRGQSLFDLGGFQERMEYLYLAYPDLTPVHYQRNRSSGAPEGPASEDTFLLRLVGDHFVLQHGEEEKRTVEYASGLVGFDLVTHLARLVPLDPEAAVAFRMLDEDGTIRRVEFRADRPERIELGGEQVEATPVTHTGLASPEGAGTTFVLWIVPGRGIVRFEARLPDEGRIAFEAASPEEFQKRYGSPVEAALEFLLALAARDRERLEARLDFRESYFLSLSKNALLGGLTIDELDAIWARTASAFSETLLASLLREPPPFAPPADEPAAGLRARLEALETASGARAVVLYRPASGPPVYLYLRRDGAGWRVAYVTKEGG